MISSASAYSIYKQLNVGRDMLVVALVGITGVVTLAGSVAAWWLKSRNSALPKPPLAVQSRGPVPLKTPTGAASAQQSTEAIPIGAAWEDRQQRGEAEASEVHPFARNTAACLGSDSLDQIQPPIR